MGSIPLENHPCKSCYFTSTCQLPFAMVLHKYIRAWCPGRSARLVATLWFILTSAFSCTLCALCNLIFTFVWFPFKLILPTNVFYSILELKTAFFFGLCGRLLLFLNSVTWPVFEYHGPLPNHPQITVARDFSDLPSSPFQSSAPNTIDSQHSSDTKWRSTSSHKMFRRQSDDASSPDVSPNTSLHNISSLHDTLSPDTYEKSTAPSTPPSPSYGTINFATHNQKVRSRRSKFKKHVSGDPCSLDHDCSVCQFSFSPTSSPFYVPKKTVIMANHLSNADGFILSGVLSWGFKIIYKAELNKVPFLGPCMMATRHVPIQFNSSKGGWGVAKMVIQEMMHRVHRLVTLGVPVLVFPEGTRRRFNRMSPFRTGFFKFCIDTKTDAYPIVLHGAQYSWPTGSFLVDFHEIYVVHGTEPISSEGHTVDSLIKEVRNSMVDMLKLCPGYNYEVEKPIETLQEFEALENVSREKLSFF